MSKPKRAKPKPTVTPYGPQPGSFTYALKPYTVEIRPDGWWMFKTHDGKPVQGPFATIEDVCLAIAREFATEIANRHSVLAAYHKIGPGHPLHGLKPTTTLKKTPVRTA